MTDQTVDLTGYDILLVNSSGGKDSQAMLHAVVQAADAQGVRDRVVVVHATFAEEWAGTEDIARQQADAYGLPFHVVAHASGSLLAQVAKRGRWPDAKNRYCTSDMKRDQVRKLTTKLTHAHPAYKVRPVRVLNCMGIRAAESPARSKKAPLVVSESTSVREVTTYYPIFGWSLAEVWATIRAAGTPVHPAYALGMPRLSCVFCVFAPKAALMLAGQHNPELLAKYVAVEQQTGHSFTASLKIAEVADALAAGETPGPIRTWEM